MTKEIENIKFGKQVAALRRAKGLSQEQFSFRCNINRTYMGEIERGEKSPSLLVIAKIAKALDISKSEQICRSSRYCSKGDIDIIY